MATSAPYVARRCRACGEAGHNRRSCMRRKVDPRVAAEGAPLYEVFGDRLTRDEERELSRRWTDDGDRAALARLVKSNLALVVKIAQDFRASGPELADLVQEGNIGLFHAAERFDPEMATRLSTYSSYWIRAYMIKLVQRQGVVRIDTTPEKRAIFFGLARARRKLERAGKPTDAASLAAELGVEVRDVEALLPRLTPKDVSFDAPLADRDSNLGDKLGSDAPSSEEMYADVEEAAVQRAQLRAAMPVLDSREAFVVRSRYLLKKAKTLTEIAKVFDVSREWIRQIEARALGKLRRAVGRG